MWARALRNQLGVLAQLDPAEGAGSARNAEYCVGGEVDASHLLVLGLMLSLQRVRERRDGSAPAQPMLNEAAQLLQLGNTLGLPDVVEAQLDVFEGAVETFRVAGQTRAVTQLERFITGFRASAGLLRDMNT